MSLILYIPNQVPPLPNTSCTNERRLYENATRRAALIFGPMQIPSPRNETRPLQRSQLSEPTAALAAGNDIGHSRHCSARQSRSAAPQIKRVKEQKGRDSSRRTRSAKHPQTGRWISVGVVWRASESEHGSGSPIYGRDGAGAMPTRAGSGFSTGADF